MILSNTSQHFLFSPGKVILSGEHSVVYGYPAVVSSLNIGIHARVTKDLKSGIPKNHAYEKVIFSVFSDKFGKITDSILVETLFDIPVSSGLGSSAAYAHAILLSLADYFSIKIPKKTMFDLVLKCESFIHGSPSGIDPCAVVYGGTNLFKKGDKLGSFEKEKIKLKTKYNFLLINSGQSIESTGDMVKLVASNIQKDQNLKQSLKTIGQISISLKDELENGTFTGKLLTRNQRELEKIGVVGLKAKQIIREIEKTGGNAKVTGAGGIKSGSGLLLAYSSKISELEKICNQNSWVFYKTTIK